MSRWKLIWFLITNRKVQIMGPSSLGRWAEGGKPWERVMIDYIGKVKDEARN